MRTELYKNRLTKFHVSFWKDGIHNFETWVDRVPGLGEEILFNTEESNISGVVKRIRSVYVDLPENENVDHYEYYVINLADLPEV